MRTWKYVESDADGQLWISNPDELVASIDILSDDDPKDRHWRRISVVTKAWVNRQLAESVRVVFGPMLVLDNSSPSSLHHSIDAAVAADGLINFAIRVEDS